MTKTSIFLALGFLSACAQESSPDPQSSPGDTDPEPSLLRAQRAADGHLRLVEANITTGNQQAYEDPGIRIFRGLAPDVAMIQELNYKTSSAADIRSFVDQAFGPDYSFYREPGTEQIPNGIVSRYPILASGEWIDAKVGNRGFAWARIDIPGPIDLYAVSVHLLTSSETNRDAEAHELVQSIQGFPAGAYVVLGGDFNTATRTEAGIVTLSSALVTAGPWPVDQAGNDNTSGPRSKPHDWVLVNPALQAKETPVDIGANAFSSGFVADTRVYTPIDDLAPALATDSGAPSMQHMAVVRDFIVTSDPQATVQVTAPNGGETWPAGTSQTITWTATGISNVAVELTTDGTIWTTLAASTAAAAGQLAFTVPSTATTAARVRVSAVPTGSPSDASDAPFNITVGPPPSAHVFVNEILANEPGSATSGEFVELVNSGNAAADLSGWKISDAASVRHVFAAGTLLAPHHAIVVFGSSAGIPAGLTNAVGSSTGNLSLTNSGDTVTLTDAQSATIDRVSYTSTLASVDGESMNRKPDGESTGSFVLHETLSARPSSPGTRVDGTSF